MALDTVHLHLTDYSIAEGNSLIIQPSPYMASTGEKVSDFHLFRDDTGREHTGARAYFNPPDRFQLTLQPFTRTKAGVNCFVQFSVPKVHYGNNFYSVGEEGSQAVFKSIEKELWQAGIHTDIETADLCRVDTFKNIEPEEEFSAYAPLFGLLKMRRGADTAYPEGFLLKNTQQQFCVYDKIAEMQKRKVDISHFPAQTMRFEHRCMNKDKVQAIFGFTSVHDLFAGGYQAVKKQQVNQWKNNLFEKPVEEIIIERAKTLEAEMKYYKEHYPHSWFDRFMRGYGARYLVENTGIEVIKHALQSFEVDRKKVWRAEQTLQQVKSEMDMLKKVEGKDKTLGTLYMELREKVCLN